MADSWRFTMVTRKGNGHGRMKEEKDACTRPLLKLKQQEDFIERELAGAIGHMKIDSNILQDIEKYVDEVTKARQTLLGNLCEHLEKIRTELRTVKCAAEFPEEMKRLDVDAYKARLLKLSQQIQDFKKCCTIESFEEESSVLESDLSDFETNLKKFLHAPKNVISRSVIRKKDEKRKSVNYNEAKDFHVLVARTGHTESWSEEDHRLYVNLRKKCNNIPALVAAIQLKCPDLSIETIVNHEAWYRKYLALRDKQKSAVLKWRREKMEENTPNLEEENISNMQEPAGQKDLPEDNVECNWTKEMSEIKFDKNHEELYSSDSTNSERSRIKELIKKWRVEKENQRAEEEEQVKMRKESRRLFQENRKQRKLQRIRTVLNEYRRRKALKQEVENSLQKEREKSTFDAALVKAFREQDKEYAKRKKELISRSQKPRKTEINLDAKKPVTVRSNTTLFNPTEIWSAKCKVDIQADKDANNLQYIKDVPRLSTKWRNEESMDLRANTTSA